MTGNTFGANCPPNHQWQLGKTAGTIRFVNNLQSKLENLAPADQSKLQDIIDSLKAGTKTLTEVAAENQVFLGGL